MNGFIKVAKRYVETALEYSKNLNIGNGSQGPFDHLFKLKRNTCNSSRLQVFDPSDLFLYAVTDSGMNKKWGRPITDAVKAAIEGGATIVQIRFSFSPFSFLLLLLMFSCFRNYFFYFGCTRSRFACFSMGLSVITRDGKKGGK